MKISGRVLFGRLLLVVVLLVAVPCGTVAIYGWWVLAASRPALSGAVALPGLTGEARVVRDANGVPTISAATRVDLVRALGFVHGQERFFQMDLLRRAGAGELSALVGPAALEIDRARRLHRFRARAAAAWSAQPASDRALLTAYTEGVNAGLAALHRAPWEYAVLRVAPVKWTELDTAMVVYAMYFDLEASDADGQIAREDELRILGRPLAAFLYPDGSPADAALDGSHLPEPPIPPAPGGGNVPAGVVPPLPEKGSNNFAVAGRLSATGAAMVENDMHLDLGVPNIWYRARLKSSGLDLVGVTLPGVPFVVVGSNTHIAWAYTDSYIETGDAVVIESPPGDTQHYKTPDGLKPFESHVEKICVAHSGCEDLVVQDTIWGPVVRPDDHGHKIVWRWIAHDPGAVNLAGSLGLESAATVRAALDVAHTAGMPDQNFVVGDSDGHIGWTIIGQVPRRVGLPDQVPYSWADGSHGWNGYLAASDVPEIVDPPDGRLWSANARTLGGDKLALLGDGGYAPPFRARAIHDDLFARDHFAENDMLAIATDDRAHALDAWQGAMHAAIEAHSDDVKISAMAPYVAAWGGKAEPESVGYRLVRYFRGALLKRIYSGLAGGLASSPGAKVPAARQADDPALRLLTERPGWLVPKPFKDWDAVVVSALNEVSQDAAAEKGGLAGFTWGALNRVGIHHPLAEAVPLLGWLTDPPDVSEAGDSLVPRVAIVGFGASERLVVSPGHEDRAIFDMPVGQSDNPLSPYYLAGQAEWVNGQPTPLLPGAARWTLVLHP